MKRDDDPSLCPLERMPKYSRKLTQKRATKMNMLHVKLFALLVVWSLLVVAAYHWEALL